MSVTGSDIIVRDATFDDVDRMTEIFNAAIPDGTAEWTEQPHTVAERREWFAGRTGRGFPVVVAVDPALAGRSSIVGLATYGDFRDSTCREGFRFTVEHSVYVAPEARGRGIGGLLLEAIVERGRAAGVRQMIGAIDAANTASLDLHARHGFSEVGRLPGVGHTFDTWRDLVLVQRSL